MPKKAADSSRAPDATLLPDLRQRFRQLLFEGTPESELHGLAATDLDRLAALTLETIAVRKAGTPKVHVGVGEGEVGHRHMPIILAIDDMPFLVDSATAAVAAHNLAIHRLIHPVLPIRRDGDGRILGFGGEDAAPESLVLMEVERAPARWRAQLARELDLVYQDVRAAVTDWPAMRNRLLAAASLTASRDSEAAAFLEWLAADHFILLAFAGEGQSLGLFRDAARFQPPSGNTGAGAVSVGRSPLHSTVRRRIPMTSVAVAGADGHDATFLGLFPGAALRESPWRVPLVRRKVTEAADRLGHAPRSHAARSFVQVIESLPREELFQIDPAQLQAMTSGILSLLDRPRPELFLRHDAHEKSASVLVYLPRNIYSAGLKSRIDRMLEAETGGKLHKYDVELRSEGLARVHYVLEDVALPPDPPALNRPLADLPRDWNGRLEAALAETQEPRRAARLAFSHGRAFPPAYQLRFLPDEAAEDILRLVALSTPADRHVHLYRLPKDPTDTVRLKIYRLGTIIPLSDSVPLLENFGFRVVSENAFAIGKGKLGWIHVFKLEGAHAPAKLRPFRALVQPALEAVLKGASENDPFNALVPALSIGADEANWLRAWFRYLRQTGVSYSIQTVVEALRRNPETTLALLGWFRDRHSPAAAGTKTAAAGTKTAAKARLDEALAAVSSIDDDRILRLFVDLLGALLRTNAFLEPAPEALAFKFDSALVPGLPKPRPWREIWVYSPRLEGIHLRGGPLARGGLRWSDRREDFRTEVLGLVNTQIIKNSVIVPTGAKGGFYAKQLPDPTADRDAWAAEGRAAYAVYIRALLSLTDNRDREGKVVPAAGIQRLDGDDPYLVVAADKGTASFSDTANEIATGAGFWLGDAFASGGSHGYDHKAMGITARGAWVSVTRHFAELGIDVAAEPATVAGVGDMSGDVFGNGMLQSKALKLVAAFDHRHIFLDPMPDPETSFAERRRLAALPRSSWADYDPALLSKGGGVYPRTQKSIPLSAEVRALLGIDDEALSPSALMAAILKAPVDLLWFGGIGTYVKAAAETNAAVGDNANNALRVDGRELRARIVGEGANLGCTQRGRIEYALAGGHINTDFIDNSAGVDTSDHEVNIKIAFETAIRNGRLDFEARNRLLQEMTAEVAALVLADNRAQTLALSVAHADADARLPAHARLIEMLEAGGRLDRKVEGLPDAQQLQERHRLGLGLTRPELAVLLSYAKMELREALSTTRLADDPLTMPDLRRQFPAAMQKRFGAEIEQHPLRREIVATMLANLLVNRGGLTLAHGLMAEFGCGAATVAAAFVAARTLFDLDSLWAAIDAADVPAAAALTLHQQAADIVRVLVGDLIQRSGVDQPLLLTTRLAPGLERLLGRFDQLLRPEPKAQVERLRQRLSAAGAPPDVLDWLATLDTLAGVAGVVALASDLSLDEAATADAYSRLGEALAIDWAQGAARNLVPADNWERLLAADTRRSFETMRLDLIRRHTPRQGDPLGTVEEWLAFHADRVATLARTIAAARSGGAPTLPMLAHLADIARQTLTA